jgi:hypothetical protein
MLEESERCVVVDWISLDFEYDFDSNWNGVFRPTRISIFQSDETTSESECNHVAAPCRLAWQALDSAWSSTLNM